MSTIIPRLVFGTDEYDVNNNHDKDSDNDQDDGHRSARSQWSTESSYIGIDSPRSVSSNSSLKSNNNLQIIVDKTLSPGASPRTSPYSSPRLEDSNNEISNRTLEPKNDIATPQHQLFIRTPSSNNNSYNNRRRPSLNNNKSNNNYSGNSTTTMKEWMENYAKDGIYLMAIGVLFLNFCDEDDEYILNVENFHALIVKLQLMHDATSILEEKNPSTPKKELLTPTSALLSSRKSSIESEEDLVAAFVTRNLPYTPFRHELKPLLNTLDRDGDGSVTYSELKDWIKRGMCMPEDKLEKFRASGNTERKLVSFLENIMDLCHSIAANLHDDLYAHDRLGQAKLDRSSFIDILNTGARMSKEFVKKKHVKQFLISRDLKWINEETLANLCGEAMEHYLEKLERNSTNRRSKRKQRLERQKQRRRHRSRKQQQHNKKKKKVKDSHKDYRSNSNSSSSSDNDSSTSDESDTSDSEADLDEYEIEEKRKEAKVFSLLRKLAFKHVNKAIEDPIKTSLCQDVKAIVEEIESRRSLKLLVTPTSTEEEEEEPTSSEMSKSSEDGDGSEEGIYDRKRRLSNSTGNSKTPKMGNRDTRIVQLSPSENNKRRQGMQRRWSNFFTKPPPPVTKPGSKTMDSINHMKRRNSRDDIENNRKALEHMMVRSNSKDDGYNNNNVLNNKQQSSEYISEDERDNYNNNNNNTSPSNNRRPSFLRRFSMSKKK